MTLTTKELLLIQDNIKMTQNSIEFMQSCAQLDVDQQVKTLCQQMTQEHQSDLQTLARHINSAAM